MSQRWSQITQLPEDALSELRTVYAGVFPIEIRDLFSSWIEDQPWGQLNEDDEADRNNALELLQNVLLLIHKKSLLIPTVEAAGRLIENKYINDPLCFIRDMKTCMNYEEQLISRFQNSATSCSIPDENDDSMELDIVKMTREFETLNNLKMTTEAVLTELEKQYQQFEKILQELPVAEEMLLNSTKGDELQSKQEYIAKQLRLFILKILEVLEKAANALQQTYVCTEEAKKSLLERDLPDWKYKQQLACNGEPLSESCIQYIQKRCQCLTNLVCKSLHHTSKFKEIYGNILKLNIVPAGSADYSVVIETGQEKLPAFLIELVTSEEQAEKLNGLNGSEESNKIVPCGNLKNNHANFELLTSGCLSAKFTNLKLTQLNRQSKKSGQKIAEEKFCILFETHITIGDYKLPSPLRDRIPFKVPTSVPWPEMASLLNIKFAYETGRGLTDANLNYIASKIYGNSRIADFSNEVMTFEMFWKEKILEGKFTFWEWFYNVMRLTTEYLAGPWKDGHIDGFVSKLEVDSYLKTTGNGTFMCRFSDSKLGGVSVSHRDSSHHDGVVHTRPFTSRDLQIRSFSSLILDKDIWTRLIPDQPKEDVFRKYSETENAKKSTGDYFGYEQFVWTIKTMYGDNKERNDSAVQNEDIDIEADREQSLQNWIDRAVESWGIEDTDMTT